MGYRMSLPGLDRVMAALGETYDIYAPTASDRGEAPQIRYGRVESARQIELGGQSADSPKSVVFPPLQTMFRFEGGRFEESAADGRGRILFARPCDVNGILRLDRIFLENGGRREYFYDRLRQKLKIFLIECLEGFEGCFCASVGANQADCYDVALRLGGGDVLAAVKNPDFEPFFRACEPCDFTPGFLRGNAKTVRLPAFDDGDLPGIHALPLWGEAAENCVGCGSCNAVCISCSCFDTTDVLYDEKGLSGERRRAWAGCMQEDFALVAGGGNVRKDAADRMRFKVLHKVHGFHRRFGAGHMCVGCGRCDARCPEDISFSGTVDKLAEALKNES